MGYVGEMRRVGGRGDEGVARQCKGEGKGGVWGEAQRRRNTN